MILSIDVSRETKSVFLVCYRWVIFLADSKVMFDELGCVLARFFVSFSASAALIKRKRVYLSHFLAIIGTK